MFPEPVYQFSAQQGKGQGHRTSNTLRN